MLGLKKLLADDIAVDFSGLCTSRNRRHVPTLPEHVLHANGIFELVHINGSLGSLWVLIKYFINIYNFMVLVYYKSSVIRPALDFHWIFMFSMWLLLFPALIILFKGMVLIRTRSWWPSSWALRLYHYPGHLDRSRWVTFGLNIFYSEEKDWARNTTRQCPLQIEVLRQPCGNEVDISW